MAKSIWSQVNPPRVSEVIALGLMHLAGFSGEFRGLGVFRGAAQFLSKACELAGDDWPR